MRKGTVSLIPRACHFPRASGAQGLEGKKPSRSLKGCYWMGPVCWAERRGSSPRWSLATRQTWSKYCIWWIIVSTGIARCWAMHIKEPEFPDIDFLNRALLSPLCSCLQPCLRQPLSPQMFKRSSWSRDLTISFRCVKLFSSSGNGCCQRLINLPKASQLLGPEIDPGHRSGWCKSW